VITWRHIGKPKIVAVINNPILRASLQIRQLLTVALHRTSKNIRVPSPPHARPMWSTIRERLEGREEETVTWYQPPPQWHQDGRRSTGSWPPATDVAARPPPAGSDNHSQLSITLTFLRISLSLKLAECASWFVTNGQNSNNILSTNVSINQTGPKLVSKNKWINWHPDGLVVPSFSSIWLRRRLAIFSNYM